MCAKRISIHSPKRADTPSSGKRREYTNDHHHSVPDREGDRQAVHDLPHLRGDGTDQQRRVLPQRTGHRPTTRTRRRHEPDQDGRARRGHQPDGRRAPPEPGDRTDQPQRVQARDRAQALLRVERGPVLDHRLHEATPRTRDRRRHLAPDRAPRDRHRSTDGLPGRLQVLRHRLADQHATRTGDITRPEPSRRASARQQGLRVAQAALQPDRDPRGQHARDLPVHLPPGWTRLAEPRGPPRPRGQGSDRAPRLGRRHQDGELLVHARWQRLHDAGVGPRRGPHRQRVARTGVATLTLRLPRRACHILILESACQNRFYE